MHGLMMDYPLTIQAILARAERMYGHKRIISQLTDKSRHEYTYADMGQRVRTLASALTKLGVRPGDRVATLCWNHYWHVEAYFAVPAMGAVLHTLNLRLHHTDLEYIINHAGDRVIIVDDILLPLLEPLRGKIPCVEHILVVPTKGKKIDQGIDYEEAMDGADGSQVRWPDLDEQTAAAMCYTSGTTGRPKGVMYSHRSIALHSMGCGIYDTLGLREGDIACPVVPMFHANAWGLPHACGLFGSTQVLPGPHLDPPSLLELFVREKVTLTAGVPTIWLGILQLLDADPGKYDLSSLRAMVVGGSAAPVSMIKGFRERHNLDVIHAWGMTETCPLGTVCYVPSSKSKASEEEKYKERAKQGMPAPYVEIRARSENGIVEWNGNDMGELEVRGPWVAASYYNNPEAATSFTHDGWFKTGDIVSIHPNGCIQIQDRAKDVIKSGGEWISSVELENAIMGHPAVAEAAVVAAFHPKWAERPLACVVLRQGKTCSASEVREYLAERFAKWWLPDAVVFVSEIPRTSAGKFLKSKLRDEFKDYLATTASADEE
ncbi:long-chain fatty acid--CoA ligase [bacterium]|nr:long-chain fatty acid--CoA ligase [bacterium]